MENKVIVKMLFGSHMYGLDTPESDRDYKGISLPTKEQILKGEGNFSYAESTGDNNSKNGADDVDTEMYSLQAFLKLAIKGETVAIDMLHAPATHFLESSPLWDWLVANRELFLSKDMSAYMGYVKKQAYKYGIKGSRMKTLEEAISEVSEHDDIFREGGVPDRYAIVGDIIRLLPKTDHSGVVVMETGTGNHVFYEILGRKYQSTVKLEEFRGHLDRMWGEYGERARLAKENNGVDWKAVSHALRAGYQLKYLYSEGTFSYPLPETRYILDVKQGRFDFTTNVQPELESIVDIVSKLADSSDLPDSVDPEFFNNKLLAIYENIVCRDCTAKEA